MLVMLYTFIIINSVIINEAKSLSRMPDTSKVSALQQWAPTTAKTNADDILSEKLSQKLASILNHLFGSQKDVEIEGRLEQETSGKEEGFTKDTTAIEQYKEDNLIPVKDSTLGEDNDDLKKTLLCTISAINHLLNVAYQDCPAEENGGRRNDMDDQTFSLSPEQFSLFLTDENAKQLISDKSYDGLITGQEKETYSENSNLKTAKSKVLTDGENLPPSTIPYDDLHKLIDLFNEHLATHKCSK